MLCINDGHALLCINDGHALLCPSYALPIIRFFHPTITYGVIFCYVLVLMPTFVDGAVWPILRFGNIPVFYRIKMDIIHMMPEILFIPDFMFPKTSLSNTFFALFNLGSTDRPNRQTR